MLAPPCTSFSIARDRTRVIRSREQPWGVDMTGASQNDQRALETGNRTMRATLKILRWLNQHKVPWLLENPHMSRMWWIPELRAAVQAAKGHYRLCDFCAYGTPWRKRTTIACGNLDEADTMAISRLCNGKHGYCSYTRQKHYQLTGSDRHGTPWTRVAQPYPAQLARAFAKCLLQPAFASATYNDIRAKG